MTFLEKVFEFLRGLTRVHIAVIVLGVTLIVAGVTALVMINSNWDWYDGDSIPVYFFNASEGRLDAEMRHMPYDHDLMVMVHTAWGHLRGEPHHNSNLMRVWPEDKRDFNTHIQVVDDMLIATFTDEYRDMTPLDEAIFRSAFTLTMVGLPTINEVKFRVAYSMEELEVEWLERVETATTIANNPSISPARISSATFELFFIDETGEGLVTETYVAADVDLRRQGRDVLERLIEGPSDPEFSPATIIPSETRVRDVIMGTGLIYVDLSSAFVSQFSGTATQARMMITSIVNTLLESTTGPGGRTRRVFFLIESQRHEEFHGVSDFHLGFTFDETMMLGYGQEYEYEYEEVEE